MAPRILLVDDTQAIRQSLRLKIEQETDWEICGEAENGKEAVERVRQLRPDVVLLDLSMPVMNGLDAAREIKTLWPGTHIVMFTLHAYPQLLEEARLVGIARVISKSRAAGSDLVQAVRSLLPA
ncbi:MAG: response regulator transcription factor [Terriglobales bacterium]